MSIGQSKLMKQTCMISHLLSILLQFPQLPGLLPLLQDFLPTQQALSDLPDVIIGLHHLRVIVLWTLSGHTHLLKADQYRGLSLMIARM